MKLPIHVKSKSYVDELWRTMKSYDSLCYTFLMKKCWTATEKNWTPTTGDAIKHPEWLEQLQSSKEVPNFRVVRRMGLQTRQCDFSIYYLFKTYSAKTFCSVSTWVLKLNYPHKASVAHKAVSTALMSATEAREKHVLRPDNHLHLRKSRWARRAQRHLSSAPGVRATWPRRRYATLWRHARRLLATRSEVLRRSPAWYIIIIIIIFFYLFIYYYSTEGPKATYTVGKSIRSIKSTCNMQSTKHREIET